MNKRALITGITGQDGAYLARLLLAEGFEVSGTTRGPLDKKMARLDALGITDLIEVLELDLLNADAVCKLIRRSRPDHIYNLAAPSSVEDSFKHPTMTLTAITQGTLNILESIRFESHQAHYYQASSSEMFGNSATAIQDEQTPFSPQSPYAAGKVCAHSMTEIYRRYYKLFACSGILFNHESPLRPRKYVSRKITDGITRIANGESICLRLGNVDVKRDFGFSGDYVRAMYQMMNQKVPDDFVIATGQFHSIREFANLAMDCCGLRYSWKGVGLEEKCVNLETQDRIIEIDPSLYRPMDVIQTRGNFCKAQQKLGWSPEVSFSSLVSMMIDSDRATNGS
jgi:GDPmannose 4,6-dehydratase